MSIVPFPSPLGILGQFVVGLLKGDKEKNNTCKNAKNKNAKIINN